MTKNPRPPPPGPPKQGAAIVTTLSRTLASRLCTCIRLFSSFVSALDVPFCHIRLLSPHYARVYSALSFAAPRPCRAGALLSGWAARPSSKKHHGFFFFLLPSCCLKRNLGGEKGERGRYRILFNGGFSTSLLIPFSVFLIFGRFLHSEGIFSDILFIQEAKREKERGELFFCSYCTPGYDSRVA